MRRLLGFLSGVLLLLASGCATAPFPPVQLTPTAPRSAAELSAGLWSRGGGKLLLRHSALFEFQGMRVPVEAMLQLDPTAGEARLVGMNEMGVKLYDITVLPDKSRVNFVIPDLARYPGFADAVAVSVRRIFLDPEPKPVDRLRVTPKSYLLTRDEGGSTVKFTLGGADAQLLEKSFRGNGDSWRVRYYRYERRDGRLFPGGIVLDDDRAGYRLTLWIESVEPANE
jgi:hypothetical protein